MFCRLSRVALVSVAALSLPLPARAADAVLTPEEQERYETLKSRKLHELRSNVALGEYVQLRRKALGNELPAPEDDLIHFAAMGIGQPYRMNARMFDLAESDCFTFTERCIALACTDSWEAAYKLQNRLRYAGGRGAARYLNHEPVADWIPANAFLLSDITASLGVPLEQYDVHVDRQKLLARLRSTSSQPAYPSDAEAPGEQVFPTAYVPKHAVPLARRALRSGDIVIVIGRYSARPVDPVMRPRAIHMAILDQDPLTSELHIIHSSPPAVSRQPLSRFDPNSSILGFKFVRLNPGARQLVAAEFARLAIVFDKTPQQKDREVARARGELFELSPARPLDGLVDIGGRQYAVIRTRAGETLWGLLKGSWKTAYELDVNAQFRARNPNPDSITAGSVLYVPVYQDPQP